MGPGRERTDGVGIPPPGPGDDADAKGLAKHGMADPIAARAMVRRQAAKSVDAGPSLGGRLLPSDGGMLSGRASPSKPRSRRVALNAERRAHGEGRNIQIPAGVAPAARTATNSRSSSAEKNEVRAPGLVGMLASRR